MALIRLSNAADKSMIYLNSDHIVAVYKKKTDTIVCTTGRKAMDGGGLNFTVSESIETVWSLIHAGAPG